MECEVRAILAEMNKLRMSRMVFAANSQDILRTDQKLSGPVETLYFAHAEFNC